MVVAERAVIGRVDVAPVEHRLGCLLQQRVDRVLPAVAVRGRAAATGSPFKTGTSAACSAVGEERVNSYTPIAVATANTRTPAPIIKGIREPLEGGGPCAGRLCVVSAEQCDPSVHFVVRAVHRFVEGLRGKWYRYEGTI